LALSDLENRGLIFRRHGKGTFAHGCAGRVYRHIGILSKPSEKEDRPLAELTRGAMSAQAEKGAGVLLLAVGPEAWSAELARTLQGVIVRAAEATAQDLAAFRDRNLHFLLFGETALPGPRLCFAARAKTPPEELRDFFVAGQAAARALTHAALTGAALADLHVPAAPAG